MSVCACVPASMRMLCSEVPWPKHMNTTPGMVLVDNFHDLRARLEFGAGFPPVYMHSIFPHGAGPNTPTLQNAKGAVLKALATELLESGGLSFCGVSRNMAGPR